MTYPLPTGWQEKKIIDISEVTSSKRIYEKEYVKSGIPFYRGKEISLLKNKEKIEEVIYISEEKYIELKNKYGVPQKNDILITAVGTIGNAYMVDNNDPFYFKDGNLIWLKNIKEHPKFLTFLFEYNQNKIIEISMGSSQKALTIIKLENLSFYFPPLEEQKRIAEVLSLCDEVIENLTELIEKKEQYKKGVMQRLLSGEVRFKGFTDEWKEMKISKLVEKNIIFIEKGKAISKNKIVEGNIPVIAGGKIPAYYHSEYTHDFTCITISASGAYSGYVWFHNYKIWASDCNVLYTEDNKYNIEFLFYYLNYIQELIYYMQTGGAQPHIYAKDIITLTVPNISIEEQKKIAGLLSAIDEEIENLKKQLELRKQQKKGLMQKLLTGEVRV